MSNENPIYGIKRLAERLAVSVGTLSDMIRDEKIPPPLACYLPTRKWQESDVQAWLDAGALPNTPEENDGEST